MATEGHEHDWRGDQQKKNNPDMDLEFNDIREKMEKLTFEMQ
jgi:hypothetical protein